MLAYRFAGARGNTLAAAPPNQEMSYLYRERGFEMAGLQKRVELYLNESHDHHHRSQRKGNQYNKNPALHPIRRARGAYLENERGWDLMCPRRGLSTQPSPTGYDAALISLTWIVLVALFKVP
jgi:hypothetical protein